MDKVRISKHQLIFLMVGFIYGIIISPQATAKQDAWFAVLITTIAALFILTLYVYISLLNREKTLIEILKKRFGKYIGGLIGLLYVWYFLHLAAIVIRNYGDYVNMAIFPETPVVFIIISLSIITAYVVRQGLEVMGRGVEIFVPLVIIEVLFVTILLYGQMDFSNWKPFLGNGFMPVLKTVQTIISFPVGEIVIFLMIFPAINKEKDLLKSALIAASTAGGLFLIVTFRDLFVLGADMLYRTTFTSATALRLIPDINLDVFYMVAALLGGSIKVTVCIYAAVVGFAQVFDVDNYKPFVYPMVALMIALSIWLYESFFDLTQWSMENYFYYAFPFQFIIPIILLIISIVKRKT